MKWYVLLVVVVTIGSCGGPAEKTTKSPRVKKLSKITYPRYGSVFKKGDTLNFRLSVEETFTIDSVIIEKDGKRVHSGPSQGISIKTHDHAIGKQDYQFAIFLSNGTVERRRHSVTLLSDLIPKQYTYRVINEFPHDPNAFIQGLFIDDDKLYESTGLNGQSTLRLVDLSTGAVLQKKELNSRYFGEGISPIGDNIYMLTYHAGECFVYSSDGFELLATFSYHGEGWGMTINNDTLIMSNGSEKLYFREPNGFTEIDQVEVYSNTEAIDSLNELEFINGKVYANRWMTDKIYIIDPGSGVVEGEIDLTGLLPDKLRQANTNVLNGIAYDKVRDKLYVTGKNWPRLYEIEVIEKLNY